MTFSNCLTLKNSARCYNKVLIGKIWRKIMNSKNYKSLSSEVGFGLAMIGNFELTTSKDAVQDQDMLLLWMTSNITMSDLSKNSFAKYNKRLAQSLRFFEDTDYVHEGAKQLDVLMLMHDLVSKNAWPLHPIYPAPTIEQIEHRINKITDKVDREDRYKNGRDWRRIEQNIDHIKDALLSQKNKRFNRNDLFLLKLLDCISWYGLRPVEWLSARLEERENNQLVLIVKNAKLQSENQQKNSFGAINPKEFRELIISTESEHKDKVVVLKQLLDAIAKVRSEVEDNIDDISDYYVEINSKINKRMLVKLSNLTKRLSVVNTIVFAEERERRISLYDMRHVFSMRSKQHGFSQQEVAAMMGHSRSSSTQNLYPAAKTRKRLDKSKFTCWPEPNSTTGVVDDANSKYDKIRQKYIWNLRGSTASIMCNSSNLI